MQLKDLPPKLQEQVRSKYGISKSKYGAETTEIDGHKFDSQFEAEHYAELKLMERAGIITDLELQPRFLLQEGFIYHGHKERKVEYVADFQYRQDGKLIVEDTKGFRTDTYKLKRKLFLYKYGDKLDFREVSNGKTNKS